MKRRFTLFDTSSSGMRCPGQFACHRSSIDELKLHVDRVHLASRRPVSAIVRECHREAETVFESSDDRFDSLDVFQDVIRSLVDGLVVSGCISHLCLRSRSPWFVLEFHKARCAVLFDDKVDVSSPSVDFMRLLEPDVGVWESFMDCPSQSVLKITLGGKSVDGMRVIPTSLSDAS